MAKTRGYITGRGDVQQCLIVVFLRGGADGLSLVAPVEDDDYYRVRPRIAIKKSDAIKLDDRFSLHPLMKDLKAVYDDGALAVVHAAGSEDSTRSHFEAQDFMEHGGIVAGGWLGRYLRFRDDPARGALSAIAIGRTLPESLRGAPAATVMQSLDQFSLGAGTPEFTKQLERLYGAEGNEVGAAAADTLAAMKRIDKLRQEKYEPQRGAEYGSDEFAHAMMQTARLLKARVGLEAATIDLGGWDSHFVQESMMEPRTERLAAGLAAFHKDLGAMGEHVSVVVMTEFGRRVAENSSFGTDHGRGSVMLVMGGGVAGGRVLGKWTALEREKLEGPGDVPVLNNYRDVLAPILLRHGAGEGIEKIFPEYELNPLELYS